MGNLCNFFLRLITNLNKPQTTFISPRKVLVVTHAHTPTCYTRYSYHDKPEVKTPLYNLEYDAKDISMGLKCVLKNQY